MTTTHHKLTYNELRLFPDDGMRHELVDGRHYMNPAPSPQHQKVSRRIQFQLYMQIELPGQGQVIDAPIDVQLTPSDVVQPDLVVVLNDRPIITDTRIVGVPNLLVEILSPSNPHHDRELKFRLYQQHQVDEYWIVDPFEETVEQYVIEAAGYRQLPAADVLVCRALPGDVSVDFREVWQ
ncbi:MAG: Uma2 family endonuclease [Planctomycetota bacterium]